MLTQRAPVLARFTRSDATRLAIAAGSLIVVADRDPRRRHPAEPLRPVRGRRRRRRGHRLAEGRLAREQRPSPTRRARPRATASRSSTTTPPRRPSRSPTEQARAFSERVRRVDTAFADRDEARRARVAARGRPIPGLTDRAETTLARARRRRAGRPSAPRRRGSSTPRERTELRDTEVAEHAHPDRGPHGRRPRRGRTDARRRAHRAAGRPELVVQQTLTDQAT